MIRAVMEYAVSKNGVLWGRGLVLRNFARTTHVERWLLSGCGVLLLILGLGSTSSWAAGTARRTALRIEFDDQSTLRNERYCTADRRTSP